MMKLEGADEVTAVVSITMKNKDHSINFAVERSPYLKNADRCPVCRWPVKISPVNISRCTNIGGPWKTSLECLNKTCRYTELSIKTMHDWRK